MANLKEKLLIVFWLILFINIYGCTPNGSQPIASATSIPSFTLLNLDSAKITHKDLIRGKRVMIIFFSPNCNHCNVLMHDMLAHINKLKNVEIIMATYDSFEGMIAFEKEHNLRKYANIKLGRDSKYFFIQFYKIDKIPFIALYDENGSEIAEFRGDVSVSTIIRTFEGNI